MINGCDAVDRGQMHMREAGRRWMPLGLALVCLLSMKWVEAHRWEAQEPADVSPLAAGQSKADGAGRGLRFRLVERSHRHIPSPPGAPSAHANAIAALPNGDLLAYWWAGQRESAPDVRIFMSRFSAGQWSAPAAVVERQALGGELGHGVRRLGNPVPWVAHDGRVHLFVVATGLGGWAAARIVQLTSVDQGRRFAAIRVLPLSPLFNTSVLVRNNPVATVDGGWLLPAYFELGNKFGMLVSFDRDGEPRWLSRIGSSTAALQPAIVSTSPTQMVAVMRSHGTPHRLQKATSGDGGRNWQDQPESELLNLGTAAAAVRLTGGAFVLAHNDMPSSAGTARQRLRLSTSIDARRWVRLLDVRSGVPDDEFSYPSMLQVGGQLHLTYTDQREAIAHAVFDILPIPDLP